MRSISASATVVLLGIVACGETAPRFGGTGTTIFIDPASATIVAGDTLRFFAAVRDASGLPVAAAVQWRSQNTAVVAIDSTGLATAALSGIVLNSTVSATSGGVTKTAAVTVKPCAIDCGTWSLKPGLPTPRTAVAIAGTPDALFVFGGVAVSGGAASSEVTEFVTTLDQWRVRAGTMPDGRAYASAGTIGGFLFVVGGAQNNPYAPTTTLRRFTYATDVWTTRAAMPAARIGAIGGAPSGAIAVGVNGILYVVGGASAVVDAYDPSTNTWSSRAPMPSPALITAGAELNGLLYTMTRDVSSTATTSVQVYDPATNVWTAKGLFPGKGTLVFAATVNGVLYAVTSNPVQNGGALAAIYAYNPTADRWTAKEPAPDAGLGSGQILVGGAATRGALHVLYARIGTTPASVLLTFTP